VTRKTDGPLVLLWFLNESVGMRRSRQIDVRLPCASVRGLVALVMRAIRMRASSPGVYADGGSLRDSANPVSSLMSCHVMPERRLVTWDDVNIPEQRDLELGDKRSVAGGQLQAD
jgi:hypothetical protein